MSWQMQRDKEEGENAPRGNAPTASLVKRHYFIQCECHCLVHLLPVKAIQRAYLVASLRQCEATSSPQVTVREMIPMMMKKSVVTHSGGSRGGIQVRSRPWMVWHCRTRPTVRAPAERGWMLMRCPYYLVFFNSSLTKHAHRNTEYWGYQLIYNRGPNLNHH